MRGVPSVGLNDRAHYGRVFAGDHCFPISHKPKKSNASTRRATGTGIINYCGMTVALVLVEIRDLSYSTDPHAGSLVIPNEIPFYQSYNTQCR